MEHVQQLMNALAYGGGMVYPLLALALIGSVIALDKFYVYLRYLRLPTRTQALVETYGFDWADLEDDLGRLGKRNYFARFFRAISDNRGRPAWWVESRAGDEAQQVQQSLGRGLWALETIVSAAPLLGLLGTIDGMMNSFQLIGASGLVDPTGITGGVAQALIVTALGLAIAIPASFAYNYFSARQAGVLDEMERLGTRLIDHIRIDQQVAGGQREAA